MKKATPFAFSCPLPLTDYPQILLAHGGGGRLMQDLIQQVFRAAFNPTGGGESEHDAFVAPFAQGQLAFTTDSFVVNPLFFPGGDIGELAVYGTVNDLAMAGARPLYLSAGFILEEGLALETLSRIVQSMAQAAKRVGVRIVTGDTKVVDQGKGDKVFINTAGIGIIEHKQLINPAQLKAGDVVLLSGDIGRHGMAIMALREGLAFETAIESDCAPLAEPVQQLLEGGIELHCLRDLTRGGLASALNEIAASAKLGIIIDEERIPLLNGVQNACEMLGLDPLYVANEGRFVALLPAEQAVQALSILKKNELTRAAVIIGQVEAKDAGFLRLHTRLGTTRIVPMLSGEELPRIC